MERRSRPGCADRGGGRLGTCHVLCGALALEAAAAGSAIDTIAVWEVPYAVGDDIRPRFEEYVADTRRARRRARRGGSRTVHAHDRRLRRQHRGQKAAGKQTAHWADSVALAPTLVHGLFSTATSCRPIDWQRSPNRSWSPPEDRSRPHMAGLLGLLRPRSRRACRPPTPRSTGDLEGPDHVVDPQIVGPLLLRFFSSEH